MTPPKTILLLEDDPVTAMLTIAAVESFGYKVMHTDTGEKAVKIALENRSIDLILSDIDLGPGIDGPEAARIIRAQKDIPIVFLTSHSEKEYVDRVKKITRYGYVVKNSGNFVLESSLEMAFQLFESQKKLEESQRRYLTIVRAAPDPIAIHREGKVIYVNPACIRLMGGASAQEEDLLDQSILKFVHPDYTQIVIERTRLVTEKQTSVPLAEIKYIKLDGSVIDVEVLSTHIEYDGQPAIQVFFRDITERKRSTNQLRLQGAALNAAANAIFITNRAGAIEWANPAVKDLTGYTTNEVVGKNPREILKSGKHNKAFYKNLWDTIIDGRVWHGEMINRRKDGSLYDEEFTITPVRNEKNAIDHFIAIKQDITKRKKVEDELRKLSQVVDQSPVSIVITDLEGNIEYVNPRALELTGYTGDELLGENPRILKSGKTSVKEYKVLWATILRGKTWKGVLLNKKKNGELFWEDTIISPIKNKLGIMTHFLSVKEDITDRKIAEEKVSNLLREKEILLKEVHHRIKNHMNNIIGFFMLQEQTLKDSQAKSVLQDARSRVQSMMVLYDRLYRSVDLQALPFNDYFSPLIDQLICDFPNAKSVQIKKSLTDVSVSPDILYPLGIIANEIITNAMKYAFVDRRYGTISITAEIHRKRGWIEIADDGVEMPKSISLQKSTGFGLQLIRMMAKQIKGKVKIIRSHGTTFRIEFPVVS